MRFSRKRGLVAALVAVGLATSALAIDANPIEAGGPGRVNCRGRNDTRRELLRCVKVDAVLNHLRAFQRIADINGGTRAAGTTGYDASADYVERRLEAAGYEVTRQPFRFDSYENSTFTQDSPDDVLYEYGVDFLENAFTPPALGDGEVSGTVVPVDVVLPPGAPGSSTSGCDAADFTGFPAGAIALIQRGTCGFTDKAMNAQTAGAAGVILFNEGQAGRTGLVSPIGDAPGLTIPVIFATFVVGNALAAGGPRTVSFEVVQETLATTNVLAELGGSNEDRVIMAGAHLDSVSAGPGINDNGSGSAALLETALQMSKNRPRNTVRFAWWGAEESGLLGSQFYVDSLNFDEQLEVQLYLNYDMVASPNFVRFIYDGDGSVGDEGPLGSDRIEALFTRFFAGRGLPTDQTPFDGRSDYGPFIAVGIPAGGLFTGAEGIKSPAQAATYGGTAGEQFDSCYHENCDNARNISRRVLNQNSDAIAFAALRYSKARRLPGDPGTRVALARSAALDTQLWRGHGVPLKLR